MSEHDWEDRPLWRDDFLLWLDLRTTRALQWLHRCPECGTRPDRHWHSIAPRWDDDLIVADLFPEMLAGRCGRCAAETQP